MNKILAAVLVSGPDEAKLLHMCLAYASEQQKHKNNGVYIYHIPERVPMLDQEVVQKLIESGPVVEDYIPLVTIKHSKKQKRIIPKNSQKQILHTNHKIRASIIRNYKQRKK